MTVSRWRRREGHDFLFRPAGRRRRSAHPEIVIPTLILLLLIFTGSAPAPSSSFQLRGIIEGFYGPAWSFRERLFIFSFMGRVGLNAYIYAPKEDPYHRRRWRDPYPGPRLAEFRRLVAAAKRDGVQFFYALSPGLTITYSDPADYRRLQEKFSSLRKCGIRNFCLFLDDVPPELTRPRDRERYGNLASAQADLINRLNSWLKNQKCRLFVCPTTYTNAWGSRSYLRELGAGVEPQVPFFWTGPDVVAPKITAGQARRWKELSGHPLLLWDNYPVNDFARWRLFLAPLKGRDPSLKNTVLGFFSNPMIQARLSTLPLASVAEWARDPDHYSSGQPRRHDLSGLFGPRTGELLAPLLKLYGDYEWDRENVFRPLFTPAVSIDIAAMNSAVDELLGVLRALHDSRQAQVQAIYRELEPLARRTLDRWQALQHNPLFRVKAGKLVYSGPVSITAHHLSQGQASSGKFSNWPSRWFVPLSGKGRDEKGGGRCAFGWDDGSYYLALQIEKVGPLRTPAATDPLERRSHLTLFVSPAGSAHHDHLDSHDLVVVVQPPETGKLWAGRLPFSGFMARYLAGRRASGLSRFFLSQFGRPLPGPEAASLKAVFRVPRSGQEDLLVSVRFPRRPAHPVRLNLRLRLFPRKQGRAPIELHLAPRDFPLNPSVYLLLDEK